VPSTTHFASFGSVCNLQSVPKNKTRVILNILFSHNKILYALSWWPSLLNTYTIWHLPPHLSYVSTLLDVTQKLKCASDELIKQKLIDTWNHIPQGIIDEATDQWQTCVKAKGRHFEHLLWSSHTTGSFESHFRHTKTGSFDSHYWGEDDITFWFLSASLYVSKRGAYWDRLCHDVVGWLVVTRVHCGQTVHPRPIVTMEH